MDFSWLDVAFVAGMLLIFAYDYWRIYRGEKSISIMVWMAEQLHPTLIAGILLASVCFAYYVRDDFPIAFSVALTAGHLVTSEGAASAAMSKARWTSASTRFWFWDWVSSFTRPLD